MNKVNSIWILGSTSEIAQEICTQFAKSGCRKFFLIAKDNKKNQKFIDNLKNKYFPQLNYKKTFLFFLNWRLREAKNFFHTWLHLQQILIFLLIIFWNI